MSEEIKVTADEITIASEENTVELTETDLNQVTGGKGPKQDGTLDAGVIFKY